MEFVMVISEYVHKISIYSSFNDCPEYEILFNNIQSMTMDLELVRKKLWKQTNWTGTQAGSASRQSISVECQRNNIVSWNAVYIWFLTIVYKLLECNNQINVHICCCRLSHRWISFLFIWSLGVYWSHLRPSLKPFRY